jgi:uncharacterized protein YndB with AHSA1/START domain
MPDIMHLIRIKASPERVFRALTTADDIRNWWTRDADLAPHAGGSGEFRFYERKIVTEVRVDQIEPAVHVGWRTVSSRRAGSLDGTTISFDLRAEDGETVLAFAHRGFPLAN